MEARQRNAADFLGIAAIILILASCTPGPRPRLQSGLGLGAMIDESRLKVISGTVLGLLPSRSVLLRLNDGEPMEVTEPYFEFSEKLEEGATYVVTLESGPLQPELTCELKNASGTVASMGVEDIQVICPELVSIQLELDRYLLPSIGRAKARVDAFFEDGSVFDVTLWSSLRSTVQNVVTLQGGGVVQAKNAGTDILLASFEGKSAGASVSVTSAALTSLLISPSDLTIPQFTQRSLTVTGYFDDGSTADLTEEVEWQSSDSNVLTLGGQPGQVYAESVGAAILTAEFPSASLDTTAEITVTAATLSELQVTPVFYKGGIGSGFQLDATVLYSDHTSNSVTNQVAWSSSNPHLVHVDALGKVTLIAAGTATLTAEYEGTTSSAEVVVTDALLESLTISPSVFALPLGIQKDLRAIGHFNDGSTQDLTQQVAWSSSDPEVFTISNSTAFGGKLSSFLSGVAEVTARLGSLSATATGTITDASLVSLSLSPGSFLIPRGLKIPLTAEGTFSDGSTHLVTRQVSWVSSDTSIAVVNHTEGNQGLLEAVYAGAGYPKVQVTAAWGGVTSPSAQITVTPATLSSLIIRPSSVRVSQFKNLDLKAYAQFSDGAAVEITQLGTWKSDEATSVFVSNAFRSQGQMTSLKEGVTNVSIYFNGLSTSLPVEVNQLDPEQILDEGVGLRARYYSGTQLASFVGSQIEKSVDYNWASGNAPLGVGNSFSVRWSGRIRAPATGTYSFFTQSDDGVRLWVDGDQVINNWTTHSEAEDAGSIALIEGEFYDIRLEFFENSGDAVIRLLWEGPGISKEVIPTEFLYPGD